MVTGEAPVSYWPVFFYLCLVIVPEVFVKVNSSQFPFSFLKWRVHSCNASFLSNSLKLFGYTFESNQPFCFTAQLVLPFKESTKWRDLLKLQSDARLVKHLPGFCSSIEMIAGFQGVTSGYLRYF